MTVYPVFLSSLTTRLQSQLNENIRQQIHDQAGGGTLVYVDDVVNWRACTADAHLAIADELLERIRQAQVFLCIFAGESHGSRLLMDDAVSSVSFFELELFAAALLGKRIVVLRHESFKPEPVLAELLKVLEFAFPDWSGLPMLPTREVVAQAVRIAESSEVPSRRPLREVLLSGRRRIAEALHIGRMQKVTPTQFLHGKVTSAHPGVNWQIVDKVLNSTGAEENHQRRLSRVWLALRELNTSDLSSEESHERLESLERALTAWQAAGGWYGLHADMPLGCLAALQSVYRVRQRRAELKTLPGDIPVYPAAELASAKYNVAKHLYLPHHRRARLLDAHRDVNLAISGASGSVVGPLTVRSNIRRRLGHVFDAARDLEDALELARANTARPDVVGATSVELGYTLLFTLRTRRGLKLCETGIEILRDKGTTTQLARMLRKTAVAYFANGLLKKAASANEQAKQLAASVHAFDQMR